MRVLDTLAPDLQRLPNSPRESIRPPDATTFPRNRPDVGDPRPAPQVNSVAGLKTKLERNGYILMDGLPVDQIPVRTYDVVAMETNLRLTEGFQKSNGRIYVLAGDEAAVRGGSEAPEPLVLRANVGEIVRINFTNKLSGKCASFAVPQLIKSNDDLGSAFGLNNDSTVAPGDTRTYWYVIDPRFEMSRSLVVSDYGDPFRGGENGLYGMFVVEPAGSTYHDPKTGEEVKSGWNVEVRRPDGSKFRDVALIFHDEDPRMNRDIMPYDRDIDGPRAINYRAEPLERRDNNFPARVLSTLVHGDAKTPLIEVRVGEQVRFHVAVGFGEQPHVATVNGHRFPFARSAGGGMHLYARVVVPRGTIDPVPEGGAGGLLGLPGDYLYRDGRNPFFEGGLWGILRVLPPSAPGAGTLQAPPVKVDVIGNSASVSTDADGVVQQPASIAAGQGPTALSLPQGTRLSRADGSRAEAVVVRPASTGIPPAPEGLAIVGQVMEFGPEGTRFDPPARMTIEYSPGALPPGTLEDKLLVAYFEDGQWEIVTTNVDPAGRTVTYEVDSAGLFALMATVVQPKPAAETPRLETVVQPKPTAEPPSLETVVQPKPTAEPPGLPAAAPPGEGGVGPSPAAPVTPRAPGPSDWWVIPSIAAVMVVLSVLFLRPRR